ncbi:MAG: TonB-dependent receptor [Pseudomonadota bacterium]
MVKAKLMMRAALAPIIASVSCTAAMAQVEQIVVTAQKREQSAQSVGIAISAFSGDQIEELGWRDSEAIAVQTPGLIATSFSGGSSTGLFSIRGISQNDFADHQEAPSAVYVDGVYLATTSQTTSELFDVERVEVLKGPQGTLFGRNATGGLVHIINKSPTDEFEGYSKLTVAEFNQIRAEGAISGPITDSVRGRLSFLTDNADGYFENRNTGVQPARDNAFGGFPAASEDGAEDFRGRDHQNVRAQIDMDVTENGVLGFTLNYGIVDNIGNAYDTVPTPAGSVDLTTTDFYGTPVIAEINAEAPNIRGFVDKETISYTADYNHSAENWNLVTILNYTESEKTYQEDDDGGPFNVATFGTDQDVSTLTGEIRLDGQTGDLTWTAGYYYLNIDGDYFGTFQFPAVTGAGGPGVFDGFGYGIDLDYALETTAHAIFGQVEYDLTDRLKLILGGRWTSDNKDYSILASCVDDPDPAVAPNTTCADAILGGGFVIDAGLTNLEKDDSFFTGKAQLEFTPTSNLLLYAGYNRGVKAGSFTAPLDGFLTVSELGFEPETLDAYEIGVKADLADDRLRVNASAFYYDYSDYQGFVFVGLASVVRNFEAEIYGGELEVIAAPGDGWDLRAGLSVLDATVLDVEVAPGTFVDQDMVLAPDVTANWLVRKEFPVNGDDALAVQFDGYYTGEQTYNTINGPLVTGDGYALMNASVSYGFQIGGTDAEASLFVRNLADEENQTYAFDLSAFFGNTIQVYGPPRIIGGSLSVDF